MVKFNNICELCGMVLFLQHSFFLIEPFLYHFWCVFGIIVRNTRLHHHHDWQWWCSWGERPHLIAPKHIAGHCGQTTTYMSIWPQNFTPEGFSLSVWLAAEFWVLNSDPETFITHHHQFQFTSCNFLSIWTQASFWSHLHTYRVSWLHPASYCGDKIRQAGTWWNKHINWKHELPTLVLLVVICQKSQSPFNFKGPILRKTHFLWSLHI